MSWSSQNKKTGYFLYRLFCLRAFLLTFVFYLKLTFENFSQIKIIEYTYFYT